jgi:tetratricopeptide (TPR) repeat protein
VAGPRLSTAAIAAVLWLAVSPARAEPFIPLSDATVVETLPGAGSKPSQELRRLTAALSRSPALLPLALKVAQMDIALGQSETDPRYDGRAEAALAPWIALPDPPLQVRLFRAILRQRVHNFSAALTDLDAVLAADPDYRQARLIRATVRQVRGDYAEALKDCAILGAPADRVGAICAASVWSVSGRAAESLATLDHAASGAFTAEELPTKLWALTIRAETASRIGRTAEAEEAFRAALGLGLRDPYLLGAYADFLLDQGRPEEAEALVQRETRIDPLLLRLALAERMLRRPSLDGHVADLAERFAAARRRGDKAHRREEARFALELLDQPQVALRLAEEDWATQHEPADARVILTAAIGARAPEAASPVIDWLRRAGLEDQVLTPLIAQLSAQN